MRSAATCARASAARRVVYADRFVPDNERERAHERGEEPRAIPFLKPFTVFNIEQCQDLPEGMSAELPPVDTDLIYRKPRP